METIKVNSEISKLEQVIIHSPDGGIGNIPPEKLEEWLLDDIIDVKSAQKEFRAFHALLLLFLEQHRQLKEKVGCQSELFSVKRKVNEKLEPENKSEKQEDLGKPVFAVDKEGNFDKDVWESNPEKDEYYTRKSGNELKDLVGLPVLDTQLLLEAAMRANLNEARELVLNICTIEGVHGTRKNDLLDLLEKKFEDSNPKKNNFKEVVKVLLTGKLDMQAVQTSSDDLYELRSRSKPRYIFPPTPNFIFTRDIGVAIGDHILITKPFYEIRKREVLLMRFIAKHFFCETGQDEEVEKDKIISVTEDDEYFRVPKARQEEMRVSYEGGDIMTISDKHIFIGCSERTSPYAIKKLVNRLFWEDIKMTDDGTGAGIRYISVIKIGVKRSQMHIDTVLSHIDKDLWVVHAPFSEGLKKEKEQTFDYTDDLYQKSEKQREREEDVSIFQFYLSNEALELKQKYLNCTVDHEKAEFKAEFKKWDFMLRKSEDGEKLERTVRVKEHGEMKMRKTPIKDGDGCLYKTPPSGLCDLLAQISVREFLGGSKFDVDKFNEAKKLVRFVYSGGGIDSFDTREQLTDACNLLVLREGVAVGYDRNYRTAIDFNEMMGDRQVLEEEDKDGTVSKEFIEHIVARNENRFRYKKKRDGTRINTLKHLIHVADLFEYIVKGPSKVKSEDEPVQKNVKSVPSDNLPYLDMEATMKLIGNLENVLILIPSNELSRARGGSHCMTMPIKRSPISKL